VADEGVQFHWDDHELAALTGGGDPEVVRWLIDAGEVISGLMSRRIHNVSGDARRQLHVQPGHDGDGVYVDVITAAHLRFVDRGTRYIRRPQRQSELAVEEASRQL
jgi:hypothetical protein